MVHTNTFKGAAVLGISLLLLYVFTICNFQQQQMEVCNNLWNRKKVGLFEIDGLYTHTIAILRKFLSIEKWLLLHIANIFSVIVIYYN